MTGDSSQLLRLIFPCYTTVISLSTLLGSGLRVLLDLLAGQAWSAEQMKLELTLLQRETTRRGSDRSG